MLAIHLDNILFFLFVAVAILFQLLTRAATKSGRPSGGNQQRRSTSPPPLRREETEEDRIRKFLEALGQPPPVKPRPTYQKPIVVPHVSPPMKSPLPPLTTRPPDLPREIRLPGQQGTPPLESAPLVKAPAEAYAMATATVAQASKSKVELATLLRSTSGLRDAIILREIFGPPRSLQPLDLVGTV
jgi:hypothetical protein